MTLRGIGAEVVVPGDVVGVVGGGAVVGEAALGGPAVELGRPPGGTRTLLGAAGDVVEMVAVEVVGVDVELHETATMMIAITTSTAGMIHAHSRRGEPPAGGGGGGGGLGGGAPYPPSVP